MTIEKSAANQRRYFLTERTRGINLPRHIHSPLWGNEKWKLDYPDEALLPPSGITTEEIKKEAFKYIRLQADNSEELIKDLERVGNYAQEKLVEAGRANRKSGDETQTHHWWMIYYLLRIGITDKDALSATILHDVHEDTNTSLEEIESFTNSRVASIVDALTKIRSTAEPPEDTPKYPSNWKQDETDTVYKLMAVLENTELEDINARLFAIIIKDGADVLHNAQTLEHLDEEIARRKAHLILAFYGPLAWRLGLNHAAEIMEDEAFKTVLPETHGQILTKLDNLVTDDLMTNIATVASDLVESAVVNGNLLPYSSLIIKEVSPYGIFNKGEWESDDPSSYLPEVTIICDSENIKWWKAYLQNGNGKHGNGNKNGNPENGQTDNSHSPFLTVNHDGNNYQIPVNLLNEDDMIMPLQLFNNTDLEPSQKIIAENKLAAIGRFISQTLEENRSIEGVVEGLTRGTMEVETPKGTLYSIPQGSTALDMAYIIGKKLGNDAISVTITRNGNVIKNMPLNAPLEPGDKVEFEIRKGIEKGSAVIHPERLDWATTNKAVIDIQDRLNKLSKDPKHKDEIMHKASIRGRQILQRVYQETSREIPNLPAFQISPYEIVDADIGGIISSLGLYVAINANPGNDNFWEEWHYCKDKIPQIFSANKFMNEYVDYVLSRPHLQITVSEQTGFWSEVTSIAGSLGLSVHLHQEADNSGSKPDILLPQIVDIRFLDADETKLAVFQQRVFAKYPSIKAIRIDNTKNPPTKTKIKSNVSRNLH